MTVLLILATFALFLTMDYFYGRKRAVQPVFATGDQVPRLRPAIVAGFDVPENLRFHPGHTWALGESPNLVRVGLDDFAARLIGKVDRIHLPQRGQWIRQGQKLATIYRNGAGVEMVSPMEGIVTDVNQAVTLDPELARRDPYGEGWLITVQAPDAKTNFRNLLGGAIARKWMEEAAARLRGRLPTMAAAMAQDGGVAVDDLTAHMPEQAWAELARGFFLS
jgi:glycine cleavage system H protein